MKNLSPLERVLDLAVVILCLPFYAIAYPFALLSDRRFAEAIQALQCPHCSESLDALTRRDLEVTGVRFRITKEAEIDWERLPCKKALCPSCGESICFDQNRRITSCEIGDHIARKERSDDVATAGA